MAIPRRGPGPSDQPHGTSLGHEEGKDEIGRLRQSSLARTGRQNHVLGWPNYPTEAVLTPWRPDD